LDIYKQAVSELLPTPTKSHYLFNLRDFAKVIFGICMSDKDKVPTPEVMARLFVHEIWRVFSDRLVNDGNKKSLIVFCQTTYYKSFVFPFYLDDRLYLLEEVRKVVARMSLNFDNIFAHLDKPDAKG
jgi:dynein heavy chain